MKVCFIGHRTIQKTEELILALKETIVSLIDKGATTFLFGSKSEFNSLAWEIVTNIKAKFPFIRRVYIRSSHQYIEKSYEEYLLKYYEETHFPPKLKNAGKFSYVERNQEMINNSTYCIFYYDKNYTPTTKHLRKNKMLPQTKCNSGTKNAYEYAQKKKKEIINLYK